MTARPTRTAPPGRIHVIGGSLRGSRLTVPSLPGLRPTPQRLRQTLFDWLAPVIAGARVLDAFAGSGALGIEALSRGAANVAFFERDPTQARAIAGDLVRLKVAGATVCNVDALRTLATRPTARFDIVLMDPPFAAALWTAAAALLDANGWLAPSAWVYVEADLTAEWSPPARWQLHRQRETGAVRGCLFRVVAD